MISTDIPGGIEVNLEKIKAIMNMASSASIKEIHYLTVKVEALNRFVSKSADRCLSFFETLKKVSRFSWTPECQIAFHKLKIYLSMPSVLVSPSDVKTLNLYLTASNNAMAAVLVK